MAGAAAVDTAVVWSVNMKDGKCDADHELRQDETGLELQPPSPQRNSVFAPRDVGGLLTLLLPENSAATSSNKPQTCVD